MHMHVCMYVNIWRHQYTVYTYTRAHNTTRLWVGFNTNNCFSNYYINSINNSIITLYILLIKIKQFCCQHYLFTHE